ncbi:MAG: ROK family protein, partial [Micromonosporaceae bacterium]
GLARGSVTKLTARLIEAGLLHELPPSEPDRQPGRPRVPVAIDSRYRVIGVHIGLPWTIIGAVSLNGEVVSQKTLPHRGTSFRSIVRRAAAEVRRMSTAQAGREVLGVGASVGGWVDPAQGLVVEQKALGWQEAPLLEALSEQLKTPVLLDNTVRAIALAESWFGAGIDVRNLLHVFIGNVVGAGMVVDRKLHYGPKSAAGYLDHLPVIGAVGAQECECGRRDCLQVVASDTAVMEAAQQQGLAGPDSTVGDLAALAREGDERASALLRERARNVGSAIALLVEILNPDRVVLGGGTVADPDYMADVHEGMRRRLRRPAHVDVTELVVPTSFGQHAVMLASATLFLDAFYRDPMAFAPLAVG